MVSIQAAESVSVLEIPTVAGVSSTIRKYNFLFANIINKKKVVADLQIVVCMHKNTSVSKPAWGCSF